MRSISLAFTISSLTTFLLTSTSTLSTPISAPQQLVFSSIPPLTSHSSIPLTSDQEAYWSKEEGVGHFSEWSKATKRNFIDDVNAGKAANWTVVMGNEGGDLDSMAAALTWAYHLSHSRPDTPTVALLQTPMDALDLRPENKLALSNVKMSPGHRDLLTIDELPIPASELAPLLRGIILVDHPVPLSVWLKAKILSIFDHHTDRGAAPNAYPRLFEKTASCTTIVSREMLNELEKMKTEYHVPHEVYELSLSAIALDSDALSKGLPTDQETSHRLFDRSNFNLDDKRSFEEVMDDLDSEMGKAKKDLEELSVRDLLRRDFKGDLVEPKSSTTPTVHLGFASIPYSMEDQIERTLHNTTEEWFEIEEQWSHEIVVDISMVLNSFKEVVQEDGSVRREVWDEDEDDEEEEEMEMNEVEEKGKIGILKKRKVREIALVVRTGQHHRLNEDQADSLFKLVFEAIENSEILDAERWHRENELSGRKMVWTHYLVNGGRKIVRPLVENAIIDWKM